MDRPSTSGHQDGIRRSSSTNQKVVNDEDDDIIYAFKRYVHVRKERKKRQTDWDYELNEVDNRDVGGHERMYGLSEEIREAAERDRNRRRTRGSAVTYSDPLVTQTDGRSTTVTKKEDENNRSRREERYRSREPQKGVYDHPFYRNHKKRSQSETNLLSNQNMERGESGKETKNSLRPTSTKGHQPTEFPTASLVGQSLTKYRKSKSTKREKSATKKDDTGFMLIGGTYANSL